MTPLLIGVAVLLFVLGAMRLVAQVDAHMLARNLRRGGGVAALAGAAYFTATGRFPVAIPLGLFGLGLLNLLPKLASLGARTQPSPGQTSKVRARAIEMELDHDSGEMRGTPAVIRPSERSAEAESPAVNVALPSELMKIC